MSEQSKCPAEERWIYKSTDKKKLREGKSINRCYGIKAWQGGKGGKIHVWMFGRIKSQKYEGTSTNPVIGFGVIQRKKKIDTRIGRVRTRMTGFARPYMPYAVMAAQATF